MLKTIYQIIPPHFRACYQEHVERLYSVYFSHFPKGLETKNKMKRAALSARYYQPLSVTQEVC